MKKKNILFYLILVSCLCRVTCAEQESPPQEFSFEFDEAQFDDMPAHRAPQTSAATECAKDIAAQVAQRCLWLYALVYDWSKKVYKQITDDADDHE